MSLSFWLYSPKGDEFKGKYFVKPIRKRIHEELRELKERKKLWIKMLKENVNTWLYYISSKYGMSKLSWTCKLRRQTILWSIIVSSVYSKINRIVLI